MCRYLGLRRATHYRRKHYRPEEARARADEALIAQMKKIRALYLSWGFVLIFMFLRRQGHRVGKQRAHRLYQEAGMSLHHRPKKARIKRAYQALLPPEHINEGWAMDFLSEMVINEGESTVRIINVMTCIGFIQLKS